MGSNGSVSWVVRQVVPVLYGRKPRGYTEIRLLAELADQAGRGPVLAALMESGVGAAHGPAATAPVRKDALRHG